MTPFTSVEATACPLGLENVDTDQLIPARFMQTPRASGYGGFLLHDLRRDDSGALRDDFALNDKRYASAQIMIGRANFGCGSSREAAVYVLADAGFRCVLAPSFGDIFASNCVQNGVLPASMSAADIEALLGDGLVISGAPIRIDLAAQLVTAGNRTFPFNVRADWKTRLINGWDDIGITQSYADAIAQFLKRDAS
ncbi:MAG: 3-isopropylmalate dehydratase small subunit, partial [Beijerinckiaceae bacterium]|nr:3-isopropylmalate dehydratase small subunit [Beijerinckiaceae bacterium]